MIIAVYFLKHSQKRKVLLWKCLFVLYLFLIVKVTVFPITFDRLPWMENISYMAIQGKPFYSIISFVKQKKLYSDSREYHSANAFAAAASGNDRKNIFQG